MKIKYQLHDMKLIKQSQCIGDLMRYYGETKFKMADSLEKIAQNKGVAVKLLNVIRKNTTSGMTLDQFIASLSTASEVDIFTFKINGKNPCEIFNTDSKNIELEIYMNPLYFATKGAMTQYLPGFRKPKLAGEEALEFYARKEQNKWLQWFEKELNRYISQTFWKKYIVVD